MDRLVDEPDAVAALAATVSQTSGIPAVQVEKDFWVTEVLRGVAEAAPQSGVEVIFKGGTSLSKAFSLIERFSEDVDVLVLFDPAAGHRANDRSLKSLIAGAERATGLVGTPVLETATKGKKRSARFSYRTLGLRPTTGLSEGVLLELGSRGGALTNTTRPIMSLLAQHAPGEMSDFDEAEPFPVRVLDPCRTLVEKLVLLHTAHGAADPSEAIRGVRHYYDVHQLLGDDAVVAELQVQGIQGLARDVCTYSSAAGRPAQGRPTNGFADSPAFSSGRHIGAARQQYDLQLRDLVWPGCLLPSFDECVEAVRAHQADL